MFRPANSAAKTAYRKNIKGYVSAPAIFMWNVEKT